MSTAAPVVLLGAKGMLGRAFREEFARRGVACTGLDRDEVDLTDPAAATASIPSGTRQVINCAAWTDVDGAEKREAEATAINGTAVGAMAARCHQIGAMLVNYGTDYVFNGQASRPYRREQPREPVNAYGRSKAAGEALLEQSGADWLHIRTSWLYAPWGNNFVRTMARLLRERPVVKVVNDQRGRPTSAEHLARATLALLGKNARGIYHGTDGGECTWYEFAREIGRLLGAPAAIEPCTTAEFPRPARRPAYSVLDVSETEQLVGSMPDWKGNLAEVIARLE
jgi:dTDP-4-dehydrorhamnose reductase